MALLEVLLVQESWGSFNLQYPNGIWPEELVEEMRGIAAGCAYLDSNTPVNLERIVALNYGFDFISALAFSGNFSGFIHSLALRKQADGWLPADRFAAVMQLLGQQGIFAFPVHCDAVAIRGSATASGRDVYFARAFQFVTG